MRKIRDKYIEGQNIMLDLGYNYRLSDIASALGFSQLKRLGVFVQKRNAIAKLYLKELKECREVILPEVTKKTISAWHLYVIRTADPKRRDELVAYLKRKGVAVNFHFPAVYSQPYYRKNGYKNIHLKNMDLYHASCITLPIYPDLKKEEVLYITKMIKQFFKEN